MSRAKIHSSQILGVGDFLANGRGYQKLPSGIVIQWGTESWTNGLYNMDVSFTPQFDNAVFVVLTTRYQVEHSSPITVSSKDKTKFTAYSDYVSSFSWIAIGY